MQIIIVIACVLVFAAALPIQEKENTVSKPKLHLLVTGNNPAEIEDYVRKARQVYEDITVDIIQGGGYGGYGGYGGQNNGYGGYGGGYGGYGQPRGYQQTDITVDSYGK